MAQSASTVFWQPGDKNAHADLVGAVGGGTIYRKEFLEHVTATLKGLDRELFELSHDIHGTYRSKS